MPYKQVTIDDLQAALPLVGSIVEYYEYWQPGVPPNPRHGWVQATVLGYESVEWYDGPRKVVRLQYLDRGKVRETTLYVNSKYWRRGVVV